MPVKIIDLLKTIIIYILTGTMLASAGYYINARQNAGQRAEVPWEKQRILEGRAVFSEINSAQLNPVQITVTHDGESLTAVYDDILIAWLYDGFIPIAISGLFNSSAECELLDGPAGSEAWRAAAESADSVYIRYAGDYIYPVIYAFLDPSNHESAGAVRDIAKVRELFILDMDPVFGVSRDSEGNVAVFRPSEDNRDREYISANINASLQTAYNISEGAGIPSRFFAGVPGDLSSLDLSASFHLPDTSRAIYSPVLAFENPLLSESGNIDLRQDYIIGLFRLLNFNHESAYVLPGTADYTDGLISVSFAAGSGQIIYRHNNPGGLHLSRFLGYDADNYSFFEKLRAASAFANALSRELAGGHDSSLFLKDIFFDGAELEIIFAYYYRGIKIDNGGIKIRISGDFISESVIHAIRIREHGLIKNIDPMLILREADRRASGRLTVNRLELVYKDNIGARAAKPVWVVR